MSRHPGIFRIFRILHNCDSAGSSNRRQSFGSVAATSCQNNPDDFGPVGLSSRPKEWIDSGAGEMPLQGTVHPDDGSFEGHMPVARRNVDRRLLYLVVLTRALRG